MNSNNLIQNGDFSLEYDCWNKVGDQLSFGIDIRTDTHSLFARLGTNVELYQDVRIESGRNYTLSFQLHAEWVGNGADVLVEGLDAHGNPIQTLAQENFPQTGAAWVKQTLMFNSGQFQMIRLRFVVFSAADIASVGVFAG